MKDEKTNKMASMPMKKLFWQMGLPMIISMVLQALYNVVDSIFVTNMGSDGVLANQALTLAFPIQIMIIAVGVGTGVGINALISKNLGAKDNESASKVAGTGIFLSIAIYLVFLIFGLFGSKWFITLFAGGNETVIEMGSAYLQICSCLSLGAIGFSVFERFLQATGKTHLSTIAQVSGALTNIVLDYVFIFPLNMGVEGAAYATVIGQFVSLILAMIFHYTKNKEIDGNLKYIKPNFNLIKGIYQIGFFAMIMQALLSVMMAGMNAILNLASTDTTILVGAFGIYYKIQQIALFSAFGLSNTIISILSFNYGMRDKERIKESIKYGIIDTLIVTLIISIFFELLASPISSLFGLTGSTSTEMIEICTKALRIASIGYIFMGLSISIQGILQALGYGVKPLIISLLRLVIFVFPIAYLFTRLNNVTTLVWWTFPIAEILTSLIAVVLLIKSYKEKVLTIKEVTTDNLIITISRTHGTGGKEIGRRLASKLNIAFFDKEEIKEYALKNKLLEKDYNMDELYNDFLSLDANKDAIIKQAEVIKDIAHNNNCVIVGRCADYILKNNPNVVNVFLYAGTQYRVSKLKEMYGDNEKEALKHIKLSDENRSKYYSIVSGKVWGDKDNYDLCINTEIGTDEVVEIIYNYVNKNTKSS